MSPPAGGRARVPSAQELGLNQPTFLKFSLPYKVSAAPAAAPPPPPTPIQELDYVYDPSAAETSAPIYNTVTDLLTALAAGPQGSRVTFTQSVTLPASAVSLPRDTRFFSVTPATGVVTVTVPPGCVLDNLRGVSSGLVLKLENATPCLTWSADAGVPVVFYVSDGAALDRSNSNADLSEIPDGSYGIYACDQDASRAVLPPVPGFAVMRGMGPGTVLLGVQSEATSAGGLLPDDFAGSGTLLIRNGIASPTVAAADFPAFTGTFLAQGYDPDPRNFGPQLAGNVLGVAAGAPAGTLPTFQSVLNVLPAGVTKLTRIYYVDPAGPSSGADGGIGAPFKTIQAAVNQARADTPLDSTGVQYENVLLVSPTKYDEDLVIDGTNMHLSIMGNGGPWMLGEYAAGSPNFAPTNARNVTWNLNANNVDLVRHSLRLGVLGDLHDGTTTHVGYNTTPRVSGVVTVSDNVLGGTTKELYLTCVVEDFLATGTCLQQVGIGAPNGVLMLYSEKSRYKTAVSATQLRVQRSRFDQFDALVTANRWSHATSSVVSNGVTLASASADVVPSGFFLCDFSGTFTGPAGAARFDGTTLQFFTLNGATLAGGNTIVLRDIDLASQLPGWYAGSAVTVDATPTVVSLQNLARSAFTLGAGKCAKLTLHVTVQRSDNLQAAGWTVSGLYRNNAGTLTLDQDLNYVDSPPQMATAAAPWTGGAPTFSVSGATVNAQVVGVAATTYSWGVRMEVHALP